MPKDEQSTIAALLRTSCALAAELDFDRLVQILTDEATALCGAQFGVFAPTFEGRHVVRFDDVTQAPGYGNNAPHKGMPTGDPPVRSYLAIPVIGRDAEVMGGLFFGHSQAGVFHAEHEELLTAVAAQAAVAIEHAQLYRDVKATHLLESRRAALAEDMSAALTGGEPLAGRLQRTTAALVDHCGASLARIWECDGNGSLQLAASAGIDFADGQTALQIGETEIGKIAAEMTPHVINEVTTDPQIDDQAWMKREGIVSFAGHPLLVEGRLVGVLAMYARERLDESTLKLLRGVAGQIAMAIERERAGEARERFRRLFLSMLGHDLRNPLGAIAISTQMLQRLPGMPEQSQAGLQRIRRGTERMTRMVQQLLDFARLRSLDSSGIPVERQSGDLDSICREVVEELRTSHPGRSIEEEYEDRCSGQWDRDRMAQVFSNLVENALNHGKPDTPVRVHLWRRNGVVCGEVYNQGEVIPPGALEGLFDPFRRVQAARTAKTQGLGLGLFITHQIVLAHGGTLFVLSSDESGTTFRLSLPAESR